jgi:hypothetical protein
MKRLYASFFLLIVLCSCRTSRNTAETPLPAPAPVAAARSGGAQAGPPALVYKTVADYSNYVSVIMNATKTEIVSYPDPSDVGDFSKPTPLKNGYLLDNRGINAQVVFLRYTYEAFSRMPQAPSLSEMKANILDKYPLTELIHCGIRYQYKNLEEELNALIDAGFPGCTRLIP